MVPTASSAGLEARCWASSSTSTNGGAQPASAERIDARSTSGSRSRSVTRTHANGRPSVSAHWAIIVVLPDPAGAVSSTTRACVVSASRSSRARRGTIPGPRTVASAPARGARPPRATARATAAPAVTSPDSERIGTTDTANRQRPSAAVASNVPARPRSAATS